MTDARDGTGISTTIGPDVEHDPDRALPPPTPVGRDSTAGVAVMAHLRKQTAALLEASSGVRADGDARALASVHATRVAARRLRSGLRIYGDLLRDDASARLRPELSWYAGLLSPIRDLDVFLAALAAPVPEPDTEPERLAAALEPWLRRRRDHALSLAEESLRSSRAVALRGALVSVARAPRFTPVAGRRAAKVLAPRVLHADRRAGNLLSSLSPADASEAWHSARITAKRARYAAEVGAPALGRPCADLAAFWAELTEPLGAAQDAVTQRALVLERVEDAALPLTAAEALACGVFVAGTHERELSTHLAAREIWRAAHDDHRRLRRAMST